YLFHSISFLYLNFIGYFGLFALFGLMLWIGIKSGLSKIELLPIPFLMFTLSQYELISFAMTSMQQYWQFFFCLVAIIFISKDNNLKINSIIFSFLFATIASFTGAGGLIVFPAILIYLLVYKKGFKNTTIWLFGTIMVFFIYFIALKYHQTAIGIASHQFVVEHML
ncbi:MAG: hypothetical protein C0173_00540, partial [Desulfurella sp.]|uniref:hypothetical protein n=1 Tax=Desulfurella sp. TaxID=1962857 RepID=UPI000CB71637